MNKLEEAALAFKIDTVTGRTRRALQWFKDYLTRSRPQRRRTAVALLSAFAPMAIALTVALRDSGLPLPALFVVSFLFCGTVALGIAAAMNTPTVVVRASSTTATARFWLAWVLWAAMGKGRPGRPLRIFALGLFVVGSALDLFAG